MDGIRRPVLGLFIISIAVFVGVLLIDNTALPPRPSVTVAVSTTPLSSPFYIAQQKGYFRDADIDVTFLEIPGGNACFQKLLSGEADLATSSNSVIMFNSFNQAPFKVLASFVGADNDIKLLSRDSTLISHPQALKGKRISIVEGSASDYFLYSYLAINGIDPSSVTTVPMKPAQMPDALHSGEVDAISVWEPFAYESYAQAPAETRIVQTKGLHNLTFNLIGKHGESPELLEIEKRILIALQKAISFIAHNPEQAQQITIEHLGLNKAQVAWAWKDYNFKLSMNRAFLVSLESQAHWAIQAGMVQQTEVPDFLRFIDTRPLRSIDPTTSPL